VDVGANFVIPHCGKLQYLVLTPNCRLITEYLPIGIAGADVRHVPGKQQDLGTLLGDALRKILSDARIGAYLYRRISEPHVAVAHHMDGREGGVFCNGEGGIYIDLFWWFGN